MVTDASVYDSPCEILVLLFHGVKYWFCYFTEGNVCGQTQLKIEIAMG